KQDISTIELGDDEAYFDYWERYNRLIASYPYHGFSVDNLVMFFIRGLTEAHWRMVNGACGCKFMCNKPEDAMKLLKEIAVNSRRPQPRRIPQKPTTPTPVSTFEEKMTNTLNRMNERLDCIEKGRIEVAPTTYLSDRDLLS